MVEYYLQIKHAHIALALLSGALFALRGVLSVSGGRRFATALPLRLASWSIDTMLLTVALMLLVVLQLNPIATPWLATKLTCLIVYIGLGHAALRGGRGRGRQAVLMGSAIVVFAFMYSVARAHHPLGLLFTWRGIGA